MERTTGVVIDHLHPDQVDEFHELVVEVLAEFGMNEDPLLDRDLQSPLDVYDSVWVAHRGGAVVGSVALRRVDGDAFYLKRMYVRPELRGAGLGRALLATALDYARDNGARAVHLDTSTSMEAAQRLYEQAGFRRTGTRTEEGARDSRCEVLYTLDLGSGSERTWPRQA